MSSVYKYADMLSADPLNTRPQLTRNTRYERTINEAQPIYEIIFRHWEQESRVRRYAPDGITIVT